MAKVILEFKGKEYSCVDDIKCSATKKIKKCRQPTSTENIDGDVYMERMIILLADAVCPELNNDLNFNDESTLYCNEELGHGELVILFSKLQDKYGEIMSINLPHLYQREVKEQSEKDDKQKEVTESNKLKKGDKLKNDGEATEVLT